MKNKELVLIGLVVLILLGVYFLPKLGFFAIGVGNLDQSQPLQDNVWTTIVGQTFTPTQNTLSKIEIQLMGTSSTMTLRLYESSAKNQLIFTSTRLNTLDGWNEFTFGSSTNPINITPGQNYYFEVTGNFSSVRVQAKSGNPYIGGIMYYNLGTLTAHPNYDLAFKTYSASITPPSTCPYSSGYSITCEKYAQVEQAWRAGTCTANFLMSEIEIFKTYPTEMARYNSTTQTCSVVSTCTTCSQLQIIYNNGVNYNLTNYNTCKYNLQTNYPAEYAKWGGAGNPVCSQNTCTSFTYSAWSTCVSNTQTRTVTSSSPSGCTGGSPVLQQACTPICTPNWQTGSWGTCIGNVQTRTVTDSNNCGILTGKPATSQSCTVICTPNCAGKNCGSDGCGGTCGTCSSGFSCVVNTCTQNCNPFTCSSLNKQCGTYSDGCSGTLNCGTCNSGYSCTAGLCLSSNGNTTTCVPKTCSQLGKECSIWGNGCGTVLTCGTCDSGKYCNTEGHCIQVSNPTNQTQTNQTTTGTCSSSEINLGGNCISWWIIIGIIAAIVLFLILR